MEGYWPLESEFAIRQKLFKEGKGFPDLHIIIMNLKSCIRGIHPIASETFMNGYLHEFFFRFNRRNFLTSIWHELIERFMASTPYNYKAIAT